jgi:hypothetical protein
MASGSVDRGQATFDDELVAVTVRVATDAEQRDAISKWAQQAHRRAAEADCGRVAGGVRCTVCGSWVDDAGR